MDTNKSFWFTSYTSTTTELEVAIDFAKNRYQKLKEEGKHRDSYQVLNVIKVYYRAGKEKAYLYDNNYSQYPENEVLLSGIKFKLTSISDPVVEYLIDEKNVLPE